MDSFEPWSGVFRAADFELAVVVSEVKSRGLAGDILIHVYSMQCYEGFLPTLEVRGTCEHVLTVCCW